jgi:predicted esterase
VNSTKMAETGKFLLTFTILTRHTGMNLFPILTASLLLTAHSLPAMDAPVPQTILKHSPSGYAIEWPLVDGWTYELEASMNLTEWTPLTWRCGGTCASVPVTLDAERNFWRVNPRPSRIAAGINLDVLFSPPCPEELAGVRAEWNSRDVSPRNVVLTGPWNDASGARQYIVRHRLENGAVTHFGAVRIPAGAPGQKFPVLLICHGGQGGGSDADFIQEAPLNAALQVVPSYRSEPLLIKQGPFKGTYQSTGTPSVQDRDADDSLALLNCVLQAFPEARANNVAMQGTSRGANVALRCAIRRPGTRGVVDFFGATDFMASYQEDAFEAALTTPGYLAPNIEIRKNIENVLDPLVAGAHSLSEARLMLIRQSPLYFAENIPSCLAQHGDSDDVVYVENSRKLHTRLTSAPNNRTAVTSPSFEYYEYPNGEHSVGTLTTIPGPTAAARRDAFFVNVLGL